MTPTEARERLVNMLAASEAPALTDAQIDDLLSMSAIASGGLAPGASGYVEAYDLNRGAAEGWRWKAGLTASKYTFGSDVHSYTRSDWHKHCLEMADRYAAKVHGTVRLTPAGGGLDPVIGNVNG